MAMVITRIEFNWHQNGSIQDSSGCGEEYYVYEKGKKGVITIHEYEPTNGNQVHYFTVNFEGGSMEKIFNPNRVYYKEFN